MARLGFFLTLMRWKGIELASVQLHLFRESLMATSIVKNSKKIQTENYKCAKCLWNRPQASIRSPRTTFRRPARRSTLTRTHRCTRFCRCRSPNRWPRRTTSASRPPQPCPSSVVTRPGANNVFYSQNLQLLTFSIESCSYIYHNIRSRKISCFTDSCIWGKKGVNGHILQWNIAINSPWNVFLVFLKIQESVKQEFLRELTLSYALWRTMTHYDAPLCSLWQLSGTDLKSNKAGFSWWQLWLEMLVKKWAPKLLVGTCLKFYLQLINQSWRLADKLKSLKMLTRDSNSDSLSIPWSVQYSRAIQWGRLSIKLK